MLRPVVAAAAMTVAVVAHGDPRCRAFRFDEDAPGAAPAGFALARTGPGRYGRWIVTPADDAPSGRAVLAQLDADRTNMRFPIALANDVHLLDLRVHVRCKAISGHVDQACGIVLRVRDPDNYYVTRANALEDNVRLYHVRGGHRTEIASWDGPVEAGVWYAYVFEARGDRLRVLWNGQPVIDVRDATFSEAGGAGLWTKADSVTWFDDLVIERL